MKKIVVVFFISFFLAVGIFFGIQYYINIHSEKGALQVTASPASKVYLDDTYIGQTPLCKCQVSDMIAPGNYTIRLTPLDNSLQSFQEQIGISQGVLTVVDRKFGGNGQSEGSIISLSPLTDKTQSELLVVSFPQGAQVSLDDQNIGSTPLLYNSPTESDHDLKISKEGYNEKEIRIRTPVGYKLTVAAYLSTSTTSLTIPTPGTAMSGSLEPSGAPSDATPTPVNRVTILTTPTGFLRVRESPSLGASEVGEVTPGDTYELVDVQSGWFEIKMNNGTLGWISSQYAQKD